MIQVGGEAFLHMSSIWLTWDVPDLVHMVGAGDSGMGHCVVIGSESVRWSCLF